MLEKYYKYKLNYQNYLILIKYGNFYECFSRDALIINKIFGYKLRKINNTFKVGFPITNINNVSNELQIKGIYYLIIDNDDISIKYELGKNNYSNYNFDIELVLYRFLRIEKIIKYLEDNITNNLIDKKLDEIDVIFNDKTSVQL